ncbi:similar to Saccharomyces cerevisiae YOL003C PFA4 Palmitoyltransferase with autoacylation activity, required for palmitoylation of amino acid permeases containing a C-terminal Phe-Trp-Cys site [Maudiozyma barnettii]|uniref:Palmitoyltransferase PFA4 n=1 Tax=Maudiozyma barnettii TaxID=61262 RepID=A0A8H2VEU5_9SACH|nr:palmitoyltransferase PFA4 [Kazachstania barnettii]CAB4254196.1 similar to Saccharomyces cerevisiae YOL003C PFA4 Palmitoyltransferase with autoacylation activity, required for palmitoylation of amino acid permeases containing a C-terminal Phe-Trp-Cys site [Kazachstania barnettii]CAD1781930.1 similar to Saccharomyces cerevisiae YOL003C PFA4 Palmitoyltransferase with autoacylation activity, required for palmitoylation of amino acid permeases containing a C-terminal Phe-Trp-Cys site [Kazachstania 
MAIKLKRPWVGIAVPCFIISFIGYNAHYFILSNFLSRKRQIIFQCFLSMIWLSYYLAIYTNPGKPIQFNPKDTSNLKFCKKCESWKPERAHHCKTCNQCVLMMDHHCPWTMNCVGYFNYPQFLRFLVWVLITTAFLFLQLCTRIKFIWDHRNSRNISTTLITKSELIFLTILTPFDAFIFLTIFVLFIRCIRNQIFNGMTQIENWELERLESSYYRRNSKFLGTLINKVYDLYPDEKTIEHKSEAAELIERKSKGRLRFMTVVNFPYDNSILKNISTALGSSPLLWIFPWAVPEGDGLYFEHNEFSGYEKGSSLQDILLALPWPPDGGRQATDMNHKTQVEVIQEDGEVIIRSNETETQRRTAWKNEWGEELEDFGVDPEED